ncbi:MAG: DsbA family protein [Candidatus Micrarchaeia archaeon]
MAKVIKEKKHAQSEEPVFLVKPAMKNYGLDYLHISLIVLVVILVVLAIALATSKPATIVKNCQYGMSNGVCNTPKYNNTQVMQVVGRILASYSSVNTSLSLLPYYSIINSTKVYYLANSSDWLVVVPFRDPFVNNAIYNMSMLLNSNLTLVSAYLQTLKPAGLSNDTVVASGVISIGGKAQCNSTMPIPVYAITDPYAPGAINALKESYMDSMHYSNSINMSYYFIFTPYAENFYPSYGIGTTQEAASYLFCAYKNGRLNQFLENFSSAFNGYPLSNSSMQAIAEDSGLNSQSFNSCLQTSSAPLEYQAKLASYYNVTSTPVFIVNCKYLAIPATLNQTIKYALGNMGK